MYCERRVFAEVATVLDNDYIHTFTESGAFTAVKPGFTEGLVVLAREVRRAAATDADRARADVLLRRAECVMKGF